METMTREHPKWGEFCRRLEGVEGCNFRGSGKSVEWDCGGGNNKKFATKILKDMGFHVTSSLIYFQGHGGHCDCEILFNVNA